MSQLSATSHPPTLSPAGVYYTLRSYQVSKRLPPASVVSDLLESGYLSLVITEGKETYELSASALHLLKHRPPTLAPRKS